LPPGPLHLARQGRGYRRPPVVVGSKGMQCQHSATLSRKATSYHVIYLKIGESERHSAPGTLLVPGDEQPASKCGSSSGFGGTRSTVVRTEHGRLVTIRRGVSRSGRKPQRQTSRLGTDLQRDGRWSSLAADESNVQPLPVAGLRPAPEPWPESSPNWHQQRRSGWLVLRASGHPVLAWQ